MMIKAFIFDWGNVLAFIDDKGFISRTARQYSVPRALLENADLENRLLHDAGKITTRQFMKNMEARLGAKMDEKEYFNTFFKNYVRPNKKMFSIIKKLKKQGYKIFLISNNSPPFVKHFKAFSHDFDRVLVSCKAKMRKPDTRLYKKLLRGKGIAYKECIYIDDRKDLCEAAGKLGMKTIRFRTNKDFIERLNRLGIKI